jgi:hypothetical protein
LVASSIVLLRINSPSVPTLCTIGSATPASVYSPTTSLVVGRLPEVKRTSSMLPPEKSIPTGRPQASRASRPGIMTSSDSPKNQ